MKITLVLVGAAVFVVFGLWVGQTVHPQTLTFVLGIVIVMPVALVIGLAAQRPLAHHTHTVERIERIIERPAAPTLQPTTAPRLQLPATRPQSWRVVGQAQPQGRLIE